MGGYYLDRQPQRPRRKKPISVTVKTTTPGDVPKTTPKKHQSVRVHCTYRLKTDPENVLETKWLRFKVGRQKLGLDDGILQMSLGECATLDVPSAFAYGAKGTGTCKQCKGKKFLSEGWFSRKTPCERCRGRGMIIPPNSDVLFDVRLLEIDGTR